MLSNLFTMISLHQLFHCFYNLGVLSRLFSAFCTRDVRYPREGDCVSGRSPFSDPKFKTSLFLAFSTLYLLRSVLCFLHHIVQDLINNYKSRKNLKIWKTSPKKTLTFSLYFTISEKRVFGKK